jgi:hypothetical protein
MMIAMIFMDSFEVPQVRPSNRQVRLTLFGLLGTVNGYGFCFNLYLIGDSKWEVGAESREPQPGTVRFFGAVASSGGLRASVGGDKREGF